MNTFDKGQQVVISNRDHHMYQKIAVYVGQTAGGTHEVKIAETGETAFFLSDSISPLPIEHQLAEAADALYEAYAELEIARREREEANRAFMDARNFVILINEKANEEAESRDWCDEYDRLIEELNDHAPAGIELTPRQREFVVRGTITPTMYISFEVRVTATSQEDANDLVSDDPESYFEQSISDMVIEEARYSGVYDYEMELE